MGSREAISTRMRTWLTHRGYKVTLHQTEGNPPYLLVEGVRANTTLYLEEAQDLQSVLLEATRTGGRWAEDREWMKRMEKE